jgi:hypothetical protein
MAFFVVQRNVIPLSESLQRNNIPLYSKRGPLSIKPILTTQWVTFPPVISVEHKGDREGRPYVCI